MPIHNPQSQIRNFFSPRGVAIIGASANPDKLGHGVVKNLVRFGYEGGIYPVNPRAAHVLDLPCYPDIAHVPDPVDLAVIIIPAPAVPEALRQCGQRGIRAVTIMSGGFAETSREGAALQDELVAIAQDYDIRLIGPNCVGTLAPYSHLNVTFLEQMPDAGAIAFISQSGAVGGAMIDWGKGQHIGLSHFASLGNTADVDETDLMDFLADDPNVGVIVLYIEGIGDGPRFMEVARQVSRRKPVVALKAGDTGPGARAVASHTAHLAGSDAAYRAAFRQSGVIHAETTADLFGAALGLAYQPPPAGDRIAILTNSGGPGALAADALVREGLCVPEPDDAIRAALRAALGPAAQLANPIDMLGSSSSHEFDVAGHILLESDAYDALLAILVPNTVNDPVGIADALARAQAATGKPVYACYMGDVSIRAGRQRLHKHHIPPYLFPESAARALGDAYAWHTWSHRPEPESAPPPTFHPALRAELQQHLDSGHVALGENDLYPWLQIAGFPIPPSQLAQTAEEAAAFARSLAAPVALKIASPDLLHKSDAGGIRLNVVPDAAAETFEELTTAFQIARPDARLTGVLVQQMAAPGAEVIVGMRRDPVFGPLLLFGGGGIYVEAFQDVAIRVATPASPLARADVQAMIEETVAGRLLAGTRGQPPGDIDALVDLILRLAALAATHPELDQLEFNPVIVHPAGQGVKVVDARAMLAAQ